MSVVASPRSPFLTVHGLFIYQSTPAAKPVEWMNKRFGHRRFVDLLPGRRFMAVQEIMAALHVQHKLVEIVEYDADPGVNQIMRDIRDRFRAEGGFGYDLWTSFYVYERKKIYFAFSNHRDAIHFKLIWP